VATIGNQFYILNNKTGESDERGWKKLELSFWVPQHIDPSGLVVYVWNTGSDPLRIDDMTIIKRYHQ